MSPIPALYRGFPLHPDDDKDPYAFRIDLAEFGIGTGRILSGHEPEAETSALHFDLLPLSLQQPAATNPRRWVAGALGVGATAVAVSRRRSLSAQ